ncbi:MAG TPA: glycosyltransferase, partial [Oligoflexia bacterium]|nr:glycosyltransferase [Oligoflexia bacterium]
GGAADIIRQGDFGIVVPIGDAENLARAILRSLSSPIRIDAAKFAKENYGVARSADEYLKVIGA